MALLLVCVGIMLLILAGLIFLSSRAVGSSVGPIMVFQDKRSRRRNIPLFPLLLTAGSIMVFLGMTPMTKVSGNNFRFQSFNNSLEKTVIKAPLNDSYSVKKINLSAIYQVKCIPGADGLNLRNNPGIDEEVIVVIPCNATNLEKIGVEQTQNGEIWFPIKYWGNTGWSAGKYLQKVN
jgi:hypothetical protein